VGSRACTSYRVSYPSLSLSLSLSMFLFLYINACVLQFMIDRIPDIPHIAAQIIVTMQISYSTPR